ncbi:UNVERIFIED_CONTAM: hypothetical protein FKN15_052866 [Acipenser sinensis]
MTGMASKLAKERAAAAGFGSNSNAVKYLNQDFEALRNQCLQAGKLFVDNTFPAVPESLGFKELGPNSSKTRGIQWKRPGYPSPWDSKNLDLIRPKPVESNGKDPETP